MATAVEELDKLIDTLTTRKGDAIDDVLSAAPRTTAVQSLRDHPDVVQFRQELTDGLIRVDTANRLLRLVSTVVTAVLAM